MAICKAVASRDFALVQQLIENGVDVEAKDAEGQTPLMVACRNGLLSFIQLLVVHGKVAFSGFPLSIACRFGHLDCVRYLAKNCEINPEEGENGSSGIHFACWNGHIEVVKINIVQER